jgi:SAM-dependent methyltransferase
MAESYDSLLDALFTDGDGLVEAVFQGARRGAAVPWERVTVRPVELKGGRRLQFSYFDGRQDVAKNYSGEEAAAAARELLNLPFRSIRAETADETIRVQFSKKGKAIVHREKRGGEAIPIDLAHDRPKAGILPADDPPAFLQTIGVATADGRIRANQERKFRQINEFLRLIDETGEIDRLDERPLRVVDLGCGSAALTFATYHYLSAIKNIPTQMTGVDAKELLMARHQATAATLGWNGLTFAAGQILDYAPEEAPAVVLALHACDTATDDALARAARWGSRLIFSAPCCHHHLQAQLAAAETPKPFRPVLRHGILRERLGDALTDALRAHILRLLGYRAEVLEFVAVEHTPKNLMIRAVLTHAPAPPSLVNEYKALKEYWGVTPYLEELLRPELDPILNSSQA